MRRLSQCSSGRSLWSCPALCLLACATLVACGDSGSDGEGASTSDGGAGGSGEGAGTSSDGGQGVGGGPSPSCEQDPPLDHSGEGTYYAADGSGNCSFPATPSDLLVAAMNHSDYAASAVCGACVAIQGPNGSVKVRIVDQCPECPVGDIDLSPEAFQSIAALEQGRVPIRWTYVSCEVAGPISYYFKDGSSEFWMGIQIRNHRTPIAKLEVMNDDGSFTELPRADYNFFINEAPGGPGPYTFRVTDTLGEVLTDSNIALVVEGESVGAAQFGGCIE